MDANKPSDTTRRRSVGVALRAALVLLLILVVFAGYGLWVQPSSRGRHDTVVARVNGDPISRARLDREVELSRIQLSLDFSGEEGERQRRHYESLSLRILIERALILREAKRRGINPTKDDLDAELKRWEAGYKKVGGLDKVLAFLRMSKDEFGMRLRETATINLLATSVAGDRPTDEEALAVYRAREALFEIPETIRVRRIIVREREEAEDLLRRIRQGEDMAALAKAHTDEDTLRGESGDAGWLTRAQFLPMAAADAAFAMEPNELSAPFPSEQLGHVGFVIFRVEGRRPGRKYSFEEVKEAIKNRLYSEKVRLKMNELMFPIVQKAKIEIYDDRLKGILKQLRPDPQRVPGSMPSPTATP